MGRTLGLGALAALVLGWSWLRLEHGTFTRELLLWTLGVAIVPALLPWRPLRLAAVPVAVVAGLYHAFGTLRPRAIRADAVDGFSLYFDVAQPFDPAAQPLMHALVVVAILGFTLAVALAIAERKPVLAAALLAGGSVWPATLLTSSNTIARGAVVLGATLVVLAGLSETARLRQASLAGGIAVVAALVLGGMPAVAKGAFVEWQTWKPSGLERLPVSVRYVWDTTYQPLDWPEERTRVFTVEAPPISRYWRATTLDTFNGDVWLESTLPVSEEPIVDPHLPAAARSDENLLEAKIRIDALQDPRLLGASVPVRYDAGDIGRVLYQETGSAFVPTGIPRGAEYTSWSYAVRPAPARLAQSRPIYPEGLRRFLIVQSRTATPAAPPFRSDGRAEEMEELFATNYGAARYRPLYEAALEVAGEAPTPYAAAVALEAHFRDGSRFAYDEAPQLRGERPVLVEFVTEARRGYCQHFASAMALMLRYLGIPARVAAGFTSGSYNQEEGRWAVTDHDAHTWVEVWFRGFGWLPFDPTPGRGQLDGAYSTASINFNPAAIAAAVAVGAGRGAFGLDTGQFERVGRPDRGQAGFGDRPGDLTGAAGGGSRGDPSLLRLVFLVGAGLAAGIALLKLTLRRSRFLTGDPRRIAGACRRELAEFLADQRIAVPPSATLEEITALLRAEVGIDASSFATAVAAARYGPPSEAADSARRARRELRRIQRLVRHRLSAWQRARGLVSLRSLGVGSA